ncbi:hypothetical protein HN630_00085 [archaeon]|jgi:hypothetical protein|nr:hypothetical protein [archaeon]
MVKKKTATKKTGPTKRVGAHHAMTSQIDHIPGLAIRGDGAIGFTTDTLPASEHFFDATHFAMDDSGENIVILFGQKSSFSKENKYNLAIEVSIPRHFVETFLHKAIFNSPGIGEDRPFIESVDEQYSGLVKQDQRAFDELLELPSDSNSFRRFSSNFMTVSLSGGQGLVEFFEVPPDLLVNIVHSRNIRKGASAKSVVSVLTNVSLLKAMLYKVKDLFEK